MMNIHSLSGNRDEWEFEYTASKVAVGAKTQKEFRVGRVTWWTEQKAKLMAEVRESGLEVTESIAAQYGTLSNNSNALASAPQINVRADLQKKLAECQSKISSHMQAEVEYDGWIQVLEANGEQRLKLTQGDWLYFFGKI